MERYLGFTLSIILVSVPATMILADFTKADRKQVRSALEGTLYLQVDAPCATGRQAFYVTGTPERFEQKTEEGAKVEIWHLRQSKGMKMGYFEAKMGEGTGLPTTIRFEDGKLVNASNAGTSSDFSLDN